jgi:hypothetical protein
MDFAFSEIRKSAISATLVLGNFSLGDVPPYSLHTIISQNTC